MSSFREYKFFRSFSAKIENWNVRKAESLWKRMRERKLAVVVVNFPRQPKVSHLELNNPTLCVEYRGAEPAKPN
ncbi:rho-type GTPase activating protein [Culex quinquefasciatus]|uniref:Rho-type GTPase activating protein n=1 Tax=Culex quinquefasciatus TaxID=7176 RepID=B0W209_CULQU|nr:rho-type GTPase activating protein [Culex quinquefasciatus]|eukprot:XP_001842743.1 rho-type GTPase activating protein [Culex quinquefasciatus]